MITGPHPHLRRFFSVAAAGLLAVALTACTARGGGQLPPDLAFNGAASFGFSFSCDDKGGTNPLPGRLHIQLSYTEHGTRPIGSSFAVHGTADTIDPVLESMFCIGQNPPPEPGPPNEVTFLGRYRLTSSAPADSRLRSCATPDLETTSCRFEVMVRDNDKNRVPSTGDYFHIALSSGTGALTPPPGTQLDPAMSTLDAATVFYTRSGVLSSGNLTVE